MINSGRILGVLAIVPLALLLAACSSPAMEILAYSSPVEPGQLAVLTVRYQSGVPCTLKLGYSAQAPGVDLPVDLPEQRTDGAGFTSWRWTFPTGTPPQDVTATASCSREGETLQDSKTLTIAAPSETPTVTTTTTPAASATP